MRMDYITAAEAAEKWGVAIRQVQRLLMAGRIRGAQKYHRSWMIPASAEKPGDPRLDKTRGKTSLSEDLDYVIESTITPWPRDNPDAILDTVSQPRLRLQYEGELAYMRGDFERVKACFREIGRDDAARLRACPLTIAAAICTGDYALYTEIEAYLKGFIESDISLDVVAFAELALNTAYVSAIAPNMVVGWLVNGDFSALHARAKLDAAYKRAKYFQGIGEFMSMLAVAETALAFFESEDGINFDCITLRMVCAMACYELGRFGDAKSHLLHVMGVALPHGFITPFAEAATALGSLMEQCFEPRFHDCYDAVMRQWKRTFANWIDFHNRFTKDNIKSILSIQDYEIARYAARGDSDAEIAKQVHLAVGTVRNRLQSIYDTLSIDKKHTRRKELVKYIL